MKTHFTIALLCLLSTTAFAQQPPYDVAPEAEPPYYRVRCEASTEPGKLDLPVQYTVWIPPSVEKLRGVVVHQHGCGEGSCKSGLTGAFDLHWQALAAKHGCALVAASYEQPQEADCVRWCDPRNGSSEAFQQGLIDLGKQSGHPELAEVPWALWGHSGGATWSGLMTLMHPERVAATWMRSGVPFIDPVEKRPELKPFETPQTSLDAPMMINIGTGEGVTKTEGRFASLWPRAQASMKKLRSVGCLIAVSVDPLTEHQCGNQRYLAIPWFDACLAVRLSDSGTMNTMPADGHWLAELGSDKALPASEYSGDVNEAMWLPNERIARAWMQYTTDTNIADTTPPAAPTNVRVEDGVIRWDAVADLESGIRQFIVLRDGKPIGEVPAKPKNRFGRPLFQNLQYSDTPGQPLNKMEFTDADFNADATYSVKTINTVGLESPAGR